MWKKIFIFPFKSIDFGVLNYQSKKKKKMQGQPWLHEHTEKEIQNIMLVF